MISIYYSMVFLIPSLVLCQKCPTFQAVIPLRASATSSNLSFAIVADGKYYLAKTSDQNLKQLNSTGVMPKGFEESQLIALIDKIDCNESQYYLIAIKVFL